MDSSPLPSMRIVHDPDLATASDLMVRTWSRPCLHYDVGLLRQQIHRPTGDPTLSAGQMTENGDLSSFVAYIPYDVEYLGRRLRAIFATFLTASAEPGAGKGARDLQSRLFDLAMERGYDLLIAMCEVGAITNLSLPSLFRAKNRRVAKVSTFRYGATTRGVVASRLPEVASGRTREYRPSDRAAALPLVGALGGDVPLKKVVSPEDVDFILLERPHCRTFVYDGGDGIRALANLLFLEVLEADGRVSRNVYFDNVTFGDLSPEERRTFLGDVLHVLHPLDYAAALVPMTGAVPMETFKAFRFRPAPRRVNLYVGTLRDGVLSGEEVQPVDRFFLDAY